MCRDWVLFEPHFEQDASEIEVGGHKIAGRLTSTGLFAGVGRKKSAKKAKVVHIGSNDLMLQGGEVVYLEPNFEFENKIEGKEYYTCRQEYILGRNV